MVKTHRECLGGGAGLLGSSGARRQAQPRLLAKKAPELFTLRFGNAGPNKKRVTYFFVQVPELFSFRHWFALTPALLVLLSAAALGCYMISCTLCH